MTRRTAHVRIGGSPHIWEDFPAIPDRFHFEWDMEVLPAGSDFDACSGSLVDHGMWEPPETLAMLFVFEMLPDRVFVDFGANVGYYTMLANHVGMRSLAIEGAESTYEVLRRNAVDSSIAPWWVTGEQLPSDLLVDDRLVVKIDLEGADHLALRSLDHLSGNVDAVLIELSPVFNAGWAEAVDRLYDWGLVGALIPEKSRPPAVFDSLADLAWRDLPIGLGKDVALFDQRDALFVRRELLV